MRFRLAVGILLCHLAAAPYAAQQADDQAFWPLLERIRVELQQLLQTDSGDDTAEALDPACASPTQHHYRAMAYEAEAQQEADDLGLELRGGYTLDQNRGVNTLDQNRRGSSDQYAYLELSWSLLRQGREENLNRARTLEHSARLARLEAGQQRLDDEHNCRRETRVQQFRSLRSAILARRAALLEPLLPAIRRGYLTGYRHLDSLLEVEGELAITQQEIAGLGGELDTRIKPLHPAAFDLNLAMILEGIRKDPRPALSAAIERARLSQASRLRDQSQFRLFVRADADALGDNIDSGGMAAGMRFQLPLNKVSNRDLQLRLLAVDEEYQHQWNTRVRRTRESYRELREQAERVQRQQYRVLRANERVRRSLTEHRLYPRQAELPTAVERMHAMVDAAIEQVRAEEELHRRIIKVLQQAQLPYDKRYLRPLGQADFGYRGRQGQRAAYLWSGTLLQHPPAVLVAFLQAKGIDSVMLTASRKISPALRAEFTTAAQRADIQIDTLFGDNHWLMPSQHAKAIARIRTAAPSGIVHLDVEPQALADFKQRQQHYLDQYLTLVTTIREAIPETQALHLSVPIWWPVERYQQLTDHTQQLVLMAYGQADAEKLFKRLKPLLTTVPHEQLSIALRPADFSNEWQLEQTIDRLRKLTGIDRFVLHGIDNYLQMNGTPQ